MLDLTVKTSVESSNRYDEISKPKRVSYLYKVY